MQALAPLRARLPRSLPLLIALAILALGTGLVVGDPTRDGLLLLAGAVGVSTLALVFLFPFAGLLGLIASSFALVALSVTDNRSVTTFDVLWLPVAAATLLGSAYGMSRHRDARERGGVHDALRTARTRLTRPVWAYFGLAMLSLLVVAARGHPDHALDSGLVLIRALQGAMLFPIALLWLDSERRVRQAVLAALAGGAMFACFNLAGIAVAGVKRAGITWVINNPGWPIESPNEGATGMLLLWVLLLARQSVRPQARNLLGMALALIMIVLTQSRSGLIAWATFSLLTIRGVRARYLIAGLVIVGLALPLVPADFWVRMERSLTLKRGSFEAFSILVRVYGYKTAWRVFQDHPLFGVGYLGYRFVSAHYNELQFVMVTAENFFLETAVGLGAVGLGVLLVLFAQLYRLGGEVRRRTPPDSFAHRLGRFHVPLVTSLVVANMSGDTFIGMLGIGQLALWCALLLRSAHLAAAEPRGT